MNIDAARIRTSHASLLSTLERLRAGRVNGSIRGANYTRQLIVLKARVLKLMAEVNAIRTFFITRISVIRVNPDVLRRIFQKNSNVFNYVKINQTRKKLKTNDMPPISKMNSILRTIINAANESKEEQRNGQRRAASAARLQKQEANRAAKEVKNRARSALSVSNNTAALNGLAARLDSIGRRISPSLGNRRGNNAGSPHRGNNAGSRPWLPNILPPPDGTPPPPPPPPPPPARRAPYNPFNKVANGLNLINKLSNMTSDQIAYLNNISLTNKVKLQQIKNGNNRSNRLNLSQQTKYAAIVRQV